MRNSIALLLLLFSFCSTAISQEAKKVYAFKTEEDFYNGKSVLLGDYVSHGLNKLVVLDDKGTKLKYKPSNFPHIGFVYDEVIYISKNKDFLGMVIAGPLCYFATDVRNNGNGVTYTANYSHYSVGLFGEEFYPGALSHQKKMVKYMRQKYPDLASRLDSESKMTLTWQKWVEYVKEYNARLIAEMEAD